MTKTQRYNIFKAFKAIRNELERHKHHHEWRTALQLTRKSSTDIYQAKTRMIVCFYQGVTDPTPTRQLCALPMGPRMAHVLGACIGAGTVNPAVLEACRAVADGQKA